ncbi:glycosyltransferase involved in cell wall biosynthesis [Motilibacter rhizosphaerae]|uniref:Glycosyltransferase involved in cell wall biosynthesis n=1 Tax=Motilibacter rhizosphaerae TaxID=598652 RepID=A0A4Q7NQ38_9ACTN|nr:glycosyltransferase family 4 protein [Motilibacter rhizosphaerae]RZS87399.1 glycosyltransferase involved in cell wall biosynthesis [Motilibacter rhizosphaerae]
MGTDGAAQERAQAPGGSWGSTTSSAARLRPVLVGMSWDTPGGLTRYLRDLHGALEAAGAAPRVLVLAPATEAPASARVVGDETAPLAQRLRGYARAAAREDAGVVDAHFALYAAWPVLAGAWRRRPLVVHFHGPWADESLAAGTRQGAAVRAKRALEGAVYRRARRLVVLSTAFADLLVEGYGVDRERVHVVRPGVDLERFTPDHEGARERLGLSGPVVVSARRLVPRMGLDVLLRAWAQLPPPPGATLLLTGEGPEAPALAALAAELGVSGSVRLLGRVTEEHLVDLYRAADACVLPSLSLEGFGLAAVEALATGTPVLVTAVGGLPEVVEGLEGGQRTGLVVPPGDVAALAERLRAALVGDLPSRDACRAHAETFSWARAAEENLAVYALAADEAAGTAARTAAASAGPGDRPLRVTYLDHCAALSGGEIALLRMLESLDGVERHVVLGEDGPLVPRLRAAGIRVDVRPMAEDARGLSRDRVGGRLPVASAVGTAAYVLRLARELRAERPDLVHTNSLKSALYGSLAARLAGVPVVWHARDRVADDYLPGPAVRLVRTAARWLPSAVLANSDETLRTLGPLRRPARVVPDPYQPSVAATARGGDGPLVVGMVGRLAPWKGQHVFLEAFAAATAGSAHRAVLLGTAMFGEDDYVARLHRDVERLGIADRVEFRGFREDVEGELAGFDVLVHASVTPEPFGQVVVEGMAAGLPVVATAAGGPAEIITSERDGLLVAPDDAVALAAALTRLLDDPGLRTRLGSAARARAADFAPEVLAPRVLEVYREVLA